jgi:localization factor PodJL
MKPGAPWSVKGIEPQTRETAKSAARRAGMTLGEWLNHVILETGNESEISADPIRDPEDWVRETGAQLPWTGPIENLSGQLNQRLAASEAKSSALLRSVEGAIGTIANRLVELDDTAAPAKEVFQERLAALEAKQKRSLTKDHLGALETAVSQISVVLDHNAEKQAARVESVAARAGATGESLEELSQRFYETEERVTQALTAVEAASDLYDITDRQGQMIDSLVMDVAATQADQKETAAANNQNFDTIVGDLARLKDQIEGVEQKVVEAKEAPTARAEEAVQLIGAQISANEDRTAASVTQIEERLSELSSLLDHSLKTHETGIQDLQKAFQHILDRIDAIETAANEPTTLASNEAEASKAAPRSIPETVQEAGAPPTLEPRDHQEKSEDSSPQIPITFKTTPLAPRENVSVNLAMRMNTNLVKTAEVPVVDRVLQRQELFESPDFEVVPIMPAFKDTLEEEIGVESLGADEGIPPKQPLEQPLDQALEQAGPVTDQDRKEDLSFEIISEEDLASPLDFDSQVDLAIQADSEAAQSEGQDDEIEDLEAQGEGHSSESLEAILERPRQATQDVEPDPSHDDQGAKPKSIDEDFPVAGTDELFTFEEIFGEPVEEVSLEPSNTKRVRNADEEAALDIATSNISTMRASWTAKSKASSRSGSMRQVMTMNDDGASRRGWALTASALITGLAVVTGVFIWSGNSNTLVANDERPGLVGQMVSWFNTDQSDRAAQSIQGGTTSGPQTQGPATVNLGTEGGVSTSLINFDGGLLKAAEAGDPKAQFALARAFANGDTVAADREASLKWYRAAANQGLAIAQYVLGSLHERGIDVPTNQTIAIDWYASAARGGNRRSMHNLAVAYARGEHIPQDLEQAAYWFTEAANFGLSDAQYNLALLYERGLGVEKDTETAYKWYKIASESGDTAATAQAERLGKTLTTKQEAQVADRLEAWAARTMDPVANGLFDISPVAYNNVEKRVAIAKTQAKLTKLGYALGSNDGIMDPSTQSAIKAYQASQNLEVTGTLTQGLIESLEVKAP